MKFKHLLLSLFIVFSLFAAGVVNAQHLPKKPDISTNPPLPPHSNDALSAQQFVDYINNLDPGCLRSNLVGRMQCQLQYSDCKNAAGANKIEIFNCGTARTGCLLQVADNYLVCMNPDEPEVIGFSITKIQDMMLQSIRLTNIIRTDLKNRPDATSNFRQ